MIELQIAWFLLIGVLLAGYALLDGFDLGAGMLHLFVARNDDERRVVLNSIGPVWDGNEVWLITGGGAIFAAFPKVYATVFSGFYLPLMLVLTALILRAISIEFRSKEADPRWRKAWDVAFAAGSFLPAVLFGVAIGNVMRGVPLTPDGEFAGTFAGLLNPFALFVGLLSASLFVVHGATWLMLKTDGPLRARARTAAHFGWYVLAVIWAVATLLAFFDAPRLFTNYTAPAAWLAPAIFVAAAVAIPLGVRRDHSVAAFAASSLTVLALVAIMGQALFPYMLPARGDLANSLTLRNASSTALTLKVMLVIALVGMPVVIAYTAYIYRNFRGKVALDEHSY